MADAIQAPKDASPAAQEILKELQAEGNEIDGLEPKPPAPKVEEPKPKVEEKPPEKTPEELEAERVAAEAGKQKPPEREAKFVPVGKHNEERHKRQEAETRAEKAEKDAADARAALAAKADKPEGLSDEMKAAAKALAEKHDLDPDFVSELLETTTKLTAKQSNLPAEVLAEIAAFKQAKAEADSAKQDAMQDHAFDSEFTEIIKEFPDLADRKEDLKQLAFSEGNINTSLRRIALEYVHDNPPPKPGRKTAEAPVTGKKNADDATVVDFANITDEQFKELNDEQLEQFQKWTETQRVRR